MPRINFKGDSSHSAQHSATRIVVILVALSIALTTVFFKEGEGGPVHMARAAIQTIAAPFRSFGAFILSPITNFSAFLGDASADSQTLSQLREENEALKQQLAQLNEYQSENARLEGILNLASSYSLSGCAARVIAYSTDSWSDTITINRGSVAGVRVGMPVTDGIGVIGQVISVSPISSTVRLLNDSASGVSALLQDSRSTGILKGSVDGSLHLQYVSNDVTVAVGEMVVTSGLGGVYPKGLPLGTVASVTAGVAGMYREIVVTPVSTASNLEEVFVVQSYVQQEEDQSVQEASTYVALPPEDNGEDYEADEGMEG